jgi:outer membrane protein OmpA-like peptidoglycan-associated protein
MRHALLLMLLALAPASVCRGESQEERAFSDLIRRVKTGDLPKINFEFDRDEVRPESFATLDAIAEVLLSNPKLKLRVMAHTDNIGTAEYNQDLSERRAKKVKTELVKRGVGPPSVRYNGYGATLPIADNDSDEGRAKNRRVEFRVTTRSWEAVY